MPKNKRNVNGYLNLQRLLTTSKKVVENCNVSEQEIKTFAIDQYLDKSQHLLSQEEIIAAFYILLKRYTKENNIIINIEGKSINVDFTADPFLKEVITQIVTGQKQKQKDMELYSGVYVIVQDQSIPINCDFCLHIQVNKALSIKYNTSLFEKTYIRQFTRSFSILLINIQQNSQQRASKFEILTDDEKHQILTEWNQTARIDYPIDKTIHELFEVQAQATQENIAVVYENTKLTYKELNEKANQLAYYIRESYKKITSKEIQPDVFIGLCVERSVDIIIGKLAILKAGGTYVALDPDYPSVRLEIILKDAEIQLIISQSAVVQRLVFLLNDNRKIFCLDTETEILARQPIANIPSINKSTDLAYLMYTSGSTGKPKGVMVEHKGVSNMAYAARDIWQLKDTDNTLEFASINFDAAAWEIWPPLLCGAALYILPEELRKDPEGFCNYMDNHKITIAPFIPPSMLAVMPKDRELLNLQTLVVAGEKCSKEVLLHWSNKRRLINAFGPAETTVCCSYSEYNPGNLATQIGMPIANVNCYVLEPNLQPVPVGVTGELCVGGIGVARGYWKLPDVTAEKFVIVSFAGKKERIYRTGDMVRYLHDGNLVFMGREDRQVKLQGRRVDLGEVESMIQDQDGVKQCAVVLATSKKGNPKLVAYVIQDSLSKLSKSIKTDQSKNLSALWMNSIRDGLHKNSPFYMVPSLFVKMDSLPTTKNDKIDYKKLPEPDFGSLTSRQNYVAPENLLQQELLAIWSKCLEVEEYLGIEHDFVDNGGDSIKAMILVSEINRTYKIKLSVADIFENKTISDLSRKITNEQKRAEQTATSSPLIVSTGIKKDIPLSSSQQIIWIAQQMSPNIPVYNEPSNITMLCNIEVQVFEDSLNELVRRHDILRIRINRSPNLVQNVLPFEPIKLPFMDLRSNPLEERERIATNCATKQAKTVIDLERESLARFLLIQFDEAKFRLYITMHHLIMDGVTMQVFLTELNALYKDRLVDQPFSWPEPKIQYSDFTVWESQQELVDEKSVKYWQEKLAGLTSLELPVRKAKSINKEQAGSTECFLLSAEICSDLHAVSKQQGVTLFMTLLATYGVLLQRYSQQDDIAIGTVISNRNFPETQKMMGNFLNTLVIRVDFSTTPTFSAFLKQIQRLAIEAYAHAKLPFSKLLENIEDRGQNLSLFQAAFIFEPPISESEFGWYLNQTQVNTRTAKFDLTFEFEENKNGIVGIVEYNTDLFENNFILQLINSFRELMKEIIVNPEQKIALLPLHIKEELKREVIEWNQTSRGDYPTDKTIHELFEAQTQATPENIAVVYENTKLTYKELNEKANQLAYYIRESYKKITGKEIQPDVFIGLCVERSVDIIIGKLAILKAGGAYVALDPDYPQARLETILEDANVRLVINQSSVVHRLMFLSKDNRKIVCLDAKAEILEKQSITNIPSINKPTDLAYLMYTSGSTGKPKGVMIEHKGVPNMAYAARDILQLKNIDRTLEFTSINFDAAALEIWPPLLCGAALYILPEELRKDPEGLCDYIDRHQITVTPFIPPSMLALMPRNRTLQTLKTLLVGGEKCPEEVLLHWSQGRRLINAFGPAETTVCSSYSIYKQGDLATQIGIPFANMTNYVLDANLQPVPIGVTGELCVGGIGVARGYWNRADVTEEKFVTIDIVGKLERIYRTGDMARYQPNGKLVYMGRVDFQVKLRGFRIELEEIETIIQNEPNVSQAAAILREDEPGNKYIAAYIVPKVSLPNADVDDKESIETEFILHIKEYLTSKLPKYMIPTTFTVMEKLPLNVNGKVDRRTLPMPEVTHETNYVEPTNELEAKLCLIWQEALRLKKVSIEDDFFQIGGDSILLIKLIGLAAKSKIIITPKQVIKHPTIFKLAKVIVHDQFTSQEDLSCDEIQFSLTPIQQFFFDSAKSPNQFNQYVLLKVANLNYEILNKSFRKLITYHDALRMVFHQYPENIWSQSYSPIEKISMRDLVMTKDLSFLDSESRLTVLQRIGLEMQQSLNISKGHLVTACLFNNGEKKQHLLIVIHHLAIDGVSWRILLDDLFAVYSAIEHNSEDFVLPEKTHSFKTWQIHLSQYANSLECLRELNYWERVLSCSKEMILPGILTDARVEQSMIKDISGSFSFSRTEDLVVLSKQLHADINEVLLTLLVKAICDEFGLSQLGLMLERHGREDIIEGINVTRTVGWFTSLFPVWVDLLGLEDWDELVQQVKIVLREAPNKGIGYGILRYLCTDERAVFLRETNNFPVIFNYLGCFDRLEQKEKSIKFATEMIEGSVAADFLTSNLLALNCLIVNGELQLTWSYSSLHFDSEKIKRIIYKFNSYFTQMQSKCRNTRKVKEQSDSIYARQFRGAIWNYMDHPVPGYQEFSRAILPLHTGQIEKPPLFLFHAVFGLSFFYQGLANELKVDCPIFGINYPYFCSPYMKFTSLVDMAAYYVKILHNIQPTGQAYYLGGFSMGGIIAYEVARQLYNAGEKVEMVCLFDTDAYSNAQEMSQEDFVKRWQNALGITGTTDLSEKWLSRCLETNHRLLSEYKLEKFSNNQRIIYFRAQEEISKQTKQGADLIDSLYAKWNLVLKYCPEIYTIPGDHFGMIMKEENFQHLALHLNEVLSSRESIRFTNIDSIFAFAKNRSDEYLTRLISRVGIKRQLPPYCLI